MSEVGSFAHLTLTQRWPQVVRRVIAENPFPAEIVTNLEALIQDLFEGQVRLLYDDQGSDLATWAQFLQPYVGRTWREMPWWFAEVYFYRRLLEATQYFQPGDWHGVDPFWRQKQAGLNMAMKDIRAITSQSGTTPEVATAARLSAFLSSGLWGNRADLSLRPMEQAIEVQETVVMNAEQAHLLVDDLPQLVDYLSGRSADRIDLIADNAGFELFSDLGLIDFLLTSQLARTVYLHLKAHPTFVSDATIADLEYTLNQFAADSDPTVQALAARLTQAIASGQLQCHADAFWTAPLSFWEMPQSLRQQLALADLVIIKGDANYRRLLGDRHWPFTTHFAEIVCYFPAPLVALRTLKSEVAAGLQLAQVEALSQRDPGWLTNGQWGVIQFVQPGA